MSRFVGLIEVPASPVALLDFTGLKDDPVACATVRLRRVRSAIALQPALAVKIGGRLYIRDTDDAKRALVEALGLRVPVAAPKPARGRRAPSSSMATHAA